MVREKLMNRLVELSDLTLIDDSEPERLAFNISVRKQVLTELYGVLKEMEGEAHKGKFDKDMFSKDRKEEIIKRFDA